MPPSTSTRACSRLAFVSGPLAAVLLFSNSARAQSDAEVAARRQLIEDARRASAAGDHTRAIDLATRASRLRMTPSLRAFLAAEHLASGQFVRAISNAEQCVNELRRDTTVNERERLLEDCQRIVVTGSDRVGRVSVEGLSDSLPGLVVRVQGETLNAALIGVATVVDPGAVVVEVSATGYRTQRQEVLVEARHTVVVRVALEREPTTSTTSASTTTAATSSATSGAASAPRNDTRNRVAPRSGPSLAGPIAVSAAGGAVLATGGLFFGLQAMAYGDCRVEANENVCAGRTTNEQAAPAVTFNRVAIASTIVGAAALAGGVTWLVLAARAGREAPTTAVAPVADATTVGLVVRGAL
ncbi:MAG: hypothetical protein JNK05_38240 [Myxococcales bacterium]|nr:hypothetical protein [Myxococcales bacterium]